MKKIVSSILSVVVGLISCITICPIKVAKAGQDEFIAPLFSGYVEDENEASLLSHDTIIDMSLYQGIGEIGEDVGTIHATSVYKISSMKKGAVFCVPYLGTMENLNKISITVNGQLMQPIRFYGEIPYYFAGDGVGHCSIIEAIESVKSTTLIEGVGKLYTFKPIGGEVEFSFQKNQEQTVIHNGISWSRQGINGYSFKGKNSDMEEYPYQIFVSNGELIDFQSNIDYFISDITYKDYVDYYLNEWIMELGEEYRPYYYSKFNRTLSGNVYAINDVLYDYSAYAFTLMKVELPIGNSQIVVNSGVYALVNALYKPYIYIVRLVSLYPKECEFSLNVKMSENLPYLIEDNIGFSNMGYMYTKQKADGYFVVCSKKTVDYVFKNKNPKEELRLYILLCCIGLGIMGGLVFLISVRKNKK